MEHCSQPKQEPQEKHRGLCCRKFGFVVEPDLVRAYTGSFILRSLRTAASEPGMQFFGRLAPLRNGISSNTQTEGIAACQYSLTHIPGIITDQPVSVAIE